MNRLTLLVKNHTQYKTKKVYNGELKNELSVTLFPISRLPIQEEEGFKEAAAVLVFENVARSVADLCERFLCRLFPIRCIANEQVKADGKETVSVYLKKDGAPDMASRILDALFELSMLLENSCAFKLDPESYKASPKTILRQPLDAAVIAVRANPEDGFSYGRNTKAVVLNLKNLRFMTCTVFVLEERTGRQNEYGVYDESGIWKGIEDEITPDKLWLSPFIR